MSKSIAIIKYNAGNIGSVGNALQRLGVQYKISDDPAVIQSADRVIFPGVGEASSTMQYLNDSGLAGLIRELKQPVLGICLGMQLMCSYSEEGDTEGLGIFPERVLQFRISQKVPHMGWNRVQAADSPFFQAIDGDYWYYFVHSFYAELGESCAAKTEYEIEFASALQRGNFFATQFHPEKSGKTGEALLKKFIDLS